MTWLAWCILATALYLAVLGCWAGWCAWQHHRELARWRPLLDEIRALPEREPVR